MPKLDFPKIHYFDQDFVEIYDKSWEWTRSLWKEGARNSKIGTSYFNYEGNASLNLFETCFSSFFLVYSNKNYPVSTLLDNFYAKQEENGAIRSDYDIKTGKPMLTESNPEGVSPPLLAWAEYNLYHKVGQKQRIKAVVPYLERHFSWLDSHFKDSSGLYTVPLEATMMSNSPREGLYYPVDFNMQQAMNALYLALLGDVLNDKDLSFRYKKHYFSLKTKINAHMWDPKVGFYFDLDAEKRRLKVKTIAAFWALMAELVNEARAEALITHLKDPDSFGTENPFPTLAADEPAFDRSGKGFCGSVYSPFTFMVIKGLEKYKQSDFARECSIRHMYSILDTYHPGEGRKGSLWEAYSPVHDGPATWEGNLSFNRDLFITYTGLATIALMIENIVGLYISLPRKTVDWMVPTLEMMGIENLALQRNIISIVSSKGVRGWEIRLESEKLYYFTVNIMGSKRKTLPVPSGKCSILVDKLKG